ncbi:transcription initiation factor IIB [Massospora cicadina]|nr:transcription initiation factor IIB [Massospora cicadina]
MPTSHEAHIGMHKPSDYGLPQPVPNIIEEYSQGDLVCGDCGMVLGDRIIDTRSEWRTFANDDGEDPSRVGAAANPLLEGSQLDTSIAHVGGATGLARDLSKIMNRTNTNRVDRVRMQVYKDIASMCEAAGYPKTVVDLAKQIYKKVDSNKSLVAKKTEVIMAASIFLACRQEGVPRTFKEISSLTRVPMADIGKCYKLIVRFLEGSHTATTSSVDLMSRFCSLLNLPMEVQNASAQLASKASSVHALAGRSPVSVAAAAIYFISHLFQIGKTAQEISEVSGVSPSTIKSAYKSLYKEKTSLVDISSFRTKVSFSYLPQF